MAAPSIPRATYRLQFRGEFGFIQAQEIVDYLDALGISHVYASPYLKARAGSTHGYDIIDHNTLNPEVGDEGTYSAFCDSLQAHGMGQILDFVPNHMGVGQADNAWWLDVLEWGMESPFAEYFDIDWRPAKAELRGKVLLPFLGDHYGAVLKAGNLRLGHEPETGTFSVWYFEHRFPVAPGQYAGILDAALAKLAADDLCPPEAFAELEIIAAGFRELRHRARSARHRTARRHMAERLKAQLAAAMAGQPAIGRRISETLEHINGTPGQPKSFHRLHRLLEAQAYRLAFWRVAAEEINYRRFFQINELAGVRVEVPAVFDAVHRFILQLIAEDRIQGLRIDHIDGLFDPLHYLTRLQAQIRGAKGSAEGDRFYVVVEKILAAHEHLRENWPIAGTTGYEFLNRVNGLFVDPEAEKSLSRTYLRLGGWQLAFETMVQETKHQVMDRELASELHVLANEFDRLAEENWSTRDHTLIGLRQALRDVVARFPVYRTYVDRHGAAPEDRRDIDWAIGQARKWSRRVDKTVFDFLQGLLTTDIAPTRQAPYKRGEVQRLAMKFQQYTGPVMAKGVEDTTFYRFNRLISLNEVGGEPARFGATSAAFHHDMQERIRRWPHAMLSTATHDTKRGEDARARINALSEMPDEWARRARRWKTLNRRRKTDVDGAPAPSANDEYLLYQTLIGAWPIEFHGQAPLDSGLLVDFRERITNYMLKAVREAKVHSSWINPNAEYEDALTQFATRLLDGQRPNPFLEDFRAFHCRIAEIGAVNSLAQTALKLTAPGVPDIYQGADLWDLSLVDPDNRRPVDFGKRRQILDALTRDFGNDLPTSLAPLLETWPDGRIKLYTIWKILSLRRKHPAVFDEGTYEPLETGGQYAENLIAFTRRRGGSALLVAVPRLCGRLTDANHPFPLGVNAWDDTHIMLPSDEPHRWVPLFAGIDAGGMTYRPCLKAADLFAEFPISISIEG